MIDKAAAFRESTAVAMQVSTQWGPRSTILVVVDILLAAKLLSYVPTYWWLWSYGADVAARIRATQRSDDAHLGTLDDPDNYEPCSCPTGTAHAGAIRLSKPAERDLFVREIESRGALVVTIGDVRCRSIARLRAFGPPRSKNFRRQHAVSYFALNLAWSTPILLSTLSTVTIFCASAAAVATVVVAVALVTVLTSAALFTAPLSRIALAEFDIHSAGLQPYLARYRRIIRRPRGKDNFPDPETAVLGRRSPRSLFSKFKLLLKAIRSGAIFPKEEIDSPQSNRDGLLFYLLSLIILSVVAYAACYYTLYMLHDHHQDFTAFKTSGHPANWVTWIYFSVITVATVGYGDIYPVNHWAQLVVVAQILTGPLLITWLLAVAFTESQATQ